MLSMGCAGNLESNDLGLGSKHDLGKDSKHGMGIDS